MFIKEKREHVNIKQEILKALPFVVVVVAVIVINKIFIFNATIPSTSMVSTLNVGDCLFGNRLAYVFSSPKRGDIITFYAPDENDTVYIKRIIGIAGDTITIDNGKVYRNGELLEEDYINEPMNEDGYTNTFEVPKGSVFVMGDNRNHSYDARYWQNSYVSKSEIIAKMNIKYLDGIKNHVCFKFVK